MDPELFSGLQTLSHLRYCFLSLEYEPVRTRGQDSMNHEVPSLLDILRPNYKWKLLQGETHDPGPKKAQSELEIPAPACNCWPIRLSPHQRAQCCPRDPPVYSWGAGGQTPKAGRDGVDFNLFQGCGAICIALEHVV